MALNIIFMGTPNFAVPILKSINDSEHPGTYGKTSVTNDSKLANVSLRNWSINHCRLLSYR